MIVGIIVLIVILSLMGTGAAINGSVKREEDKAKKKHRK